MANHSKPLSAKPLSDSKNLPATQAMLQLVRSELRSEMRAGFKQVDSKFAQVESRFNQIDSKFELMHSELSRIGVLVEEQNSRNQVVLEGLTGLWQRQERIETRVNENEKILQALGRLAMTKAKAAKTFDKSR